MNFGCIICAESFVSLENVYSTSCGHIFHYACLIQWLERSKSCPQCRFKCTEKNLIKIYFNNTSLGDTTLNQNNPSSLIDTIDSLHLQIREKDVTIKKHQEETKKLESSFKSSEQKLDKMRVANSHNEQLVAQMRHEINIYNSRNSHYKTLEAENNELKMKCQKLSSIECILLASQDEIDYVMGKHFSLQELHTMVGALKRELNQNDMKKNELKKHLTQLKNELRTERLEKSKLIEKLQEYETENCEKNETNAELNSTKITAYQIGSNHDLNLKKRKISPEKNARTDPPTRTDSPYFSVVKTGGIAMSSALKVPLGVMQDRVIRATKSFDQGTSRINNSSSSSNKGELKKLSIFQKNPYLKK